MVTAARGVRQGAPESPALFAKVMECVLEEANYPQRFVFNDLEAESARCMDDLLLWKCSMSHMQRLLNPAPKTRAGRTTHSTSNFHRRGVCS